MSENLTQSEDDEEANAETLNRALNQDEQVRIKIKEIGNIEGKPFEKVVSPTRREYNGISPPDGRLTIDVSVSPDQFPCDGNTMPARIAVSFTASDGDWETEGTATWRTRENDISAKAEKTAEVMNIEVISRDDLLSPESYQD